MEKKNISYIVYTERKGDNDYFINFINIEWDYIQKKQSKKFKEHFNYFINKIMHK